MRNFWHFDQLILQICKVLGDIAKRSMSGFFQSHMLYLEVNTMEIRTEVINADSADST